MPGEDDAHRRPTEMDYELMPVRSLAEDEDGHPPSAGLQYGGEDEPGPDANRKAEAPIDDVIETAENVGETAVGATSEQLLTKDPRTADYVDYSKAWDMAHAGNEERTKQANELRALTAIEQFPEKEKKIDDDSRSHTTHPEYGTLFSDWGVEQRDKLVTETENEIALSKEIGSRPRETLHHAIREAHGEKDPWTEGVVTDKQRMRNRAEYAKKRAERLENWAAVLNDHPVTDEYKAKYPDVYLTPETFVAWEDGVEEETQELARLEEALGDFHGLSIYSGVEAHGSSFGPWEVRLGLHDLIDQGQPEWDRWKELKENGSTTLDQIKEFYTDIVVKGVIQPTRSRINLTRNVLEDVRSGRASRPPEPTETHQAA